MILFVVFVYVRDSQLKNFQTIQKANHPVFSHDLFHSTLKAKLVTLGFLGLRMSERRVAFFLTGSQRKKISYFEFANFIDK